MLVFWTQILQFAVRQTAGGALGKAVIMAALVKESCSILKNYKQNSGGLWTKFY